MKLGSKDIKINLLISAEELSELKRHTGIMVEAFGLDSRIERYKGKRPIGFYQWDLDCLIDVIDIALDDPKEYPNKKQSGYRALKQLSQRLQAVYRKMYD